MNSTIGKIAKFAPHVLALSLTISLYSYYFATQTTGFQVVQELGEPFDVLIIGGGAAGLSAATTLYRHQHDIRIFDYDKPRNVWDTLTHALPGWEGNSPSKFREASRKELQHTGMVDFVHSEVETVEKKDDNLFYVTTADGKVSVGRKILLSMGVNFKFPDIPGYLDNFPERM
jgi:thioredoxin reductase